MSYDRSVSHDLHLTHGPIRLRPLTPDDAPRLRAIVDEASWAGMSTPLPETDAAMAEHLRELMGRPGLQAFAVERDGEFVGRTALYDPVPTVRVDVGLTIHARPVWGTEVNPACKLLLLGHAFEELGVARVGLRCDHRNTRSHRAILRLGATFEGTLRAFRRAADGTVADADHFSVTAPEWPAVRAGLETRLGV